ARAHRLGNERRLERGVAGHVGLELLPVLQGDDAGLVADILHGADAQLQGAHLEVEERKAVGPEPIEDPPLGHSSSPTGPGRSFRRPGPPRRGRRRPPARGPTAAAARRTGRSTTHPGARASPQPPARGSGYSPRPPPPPEGALAPRNGP